MVKSVPSLWLNAQARNLLDLDDSAASEVSAITTSTTATTPVGDDDEDYMYLA